MNCDGGERCRLAVSADIEIVARIHLAAFHGFFLSQLGHRFLCVMYRAFLKSPISLFVVLETASGQLAGFAVGALHGQKDRWLAIRYLPQFLLAVMPAVLRHPVIVVNRLWLRFFETGEQFKVPIGDAVLRSICVIPNLRGNGVADSLLRAFEDKALSKGAKQIFLTTDEENNERALKFYERCGYVLVVRFQQDGKRGMWLLSKNISGANS